MQKDFNSEGAEKRRTVNSVNWVHKLIEEARRRFRRRSRANMTYAFPRGPRSKLEDWQEARRTLTQRAPRGAEETQRALTEKF